MSKQDTQIKKGKFINLQIGLIALLSFCYVMHQVYTYRPLDNHKQTTATLDDDLYQSFGPVATVSDNITKAVRKPSTTPQPKNLSMTPVVEDSKKMTPLTQPKITTKNTSTGRAAVPNTNGSSGSNTPSVTETTSSTSSSSNKTFNKKSVDLLPVYPGCEKLNTNQERAACFEQKVQRLINRKFNTNLGAQLGAGSIQRVNLYFEIDKYGEVSNIHAQSTFPELIAEAQRVAKKLPKMKPAQSGSKNVKMSYSVPIIFKVSNN